MQLAEALKRLATLEHPDELSWEIPDSFLSDHVEPYLDNAHTALTQFLQGWQMRRQQAAPGRTNGQEAHTADTRDPGEES